MVKYRLSQLVNMMKKHPRFSKQCATCKNYFEVTQGQIDRGRGVSCSRACNAKANLTTHGHTTTGDGRDIRTYTSWASMKSRCTSVKNSKYYLYGAVGITVCDRWMRYELFFEDMGARPAGTSIDRIDGTKGYSPENCRWATPKQQSSNLRTTTFVVFGGEKVSLSDLARSLGIEKCKLSYRIKAGWPEESWSK